MPQTVASHQVAAFTTPINGATTDANVVRGNDNTLRTGYVNHDADPGIHLQSSALASRPAFGSAGRKWLTADTGSYRLFFDTGSAWQELSYLGTGGGTVSGNLVVTGNLTVDTNTLFVDASNNRVGIGTITPSFLLEAVGGDSSFHGGGTTDRLIVSPKAAGSGTKLLAVNAANSAFAPAIVTGSTFTVETGGENPRITVDGSGNATFSANATFQGDVTLGNATSDAIVFTGRVNSNITFTSDNTNDIGAVGTNRPRTIYAATSVVTSAVTATSAALTQELTVGAGSLSTAAVHTTSDANTGIYFPASDTLAFVTNGGERARFDSAGKFSFNDTTMPYPFYVKSDFAIAPTSSVTPTNNGDVVFELTSNTSLTIKARGSDAVVRSVSLTLA